MLPKIDGLEVAREIRRSMTCRLSWSRLRFELDKVLGLELGADDYVTKPFSNRELVARVKANYGGKTRQPMLNPKNQKTKTLKLAI